MLQLNCSMMFGNTEVRFVSKECESMANVNGLGSTWSRLATTNDYSYLFNNMSSNKNNSSTNLLGIDLAEYSSITKGSYSKLMKAYYKKLDNEGDTSATGDKSDTVAKTTLKGSANDLYKAANALLKMVM